jgi:hypothetical protein
MSMISRHVNDGVAIRSDRVKLVTQDQLTLLQRRIDTIDIIPSAAQRAIESRHDT